MNNNILLLLFFILNFISNNLPAQTAGTLTFTVSTSPHLGQFAPAHCMAIWITDSSGTFVKTRLIRGCGFASLLYYWVSNSGQNVVDAVTGCTMWDHLPPNSPYIAMWDGKDINGNIVVNGVYHLDIELTDSNGPGTYSSFTFRKDTAQQLQNPANQPSFSNITLNWIPQPLKVNSVNTKHYPGEVYPNPFNSETNFIINFKEEGPANINIYSMNGNLVKVLLNQNVYSGNYTLKWNGKDNYNKKVSEGIYYYSVTTNKFSHSGKLVLTK